MRRAALWIGMLAGLVAAGGCQSLAPVGKYPRAGSDDALARLVAVLPGEYDNHEQVAHGRTEPAPTRIQHELLLVDRDRDAFTWLWRLRSADKAATTSTWLLRAQAGEKGGHVRIVPYRPLDAAGVEAAFGKAPKTFKFVAEQWAELAPCALDGAWDGTKFVAAASVEACSALLPGLGETAALLPLRLQLDGDMLRTATFSDSARGADAIELARRVRWFDGWAAINGGGPQAKAANQDWHLDRDLRLSSEGGRAALKWRDGSPSGYTLELERTAYPERKLTVLQLNVIDDRSGATLTYAWSDPQAQSIGVNLGWLQAGLTQAPPAKAER